MMVFQCLCFSGCNLAKDLDQDDPFRVLYNQSLNSEIKESSGDINVPLITLSANQMPLSHFCRILSDTFNVGIVFSDQLKSSTVSAEFKNTDIDTVFTLLSRQLGVELVQLGNTYYLGTLKDEDRAIFIRKVLSHDEQNLEQIISTLTSPVGKGKVLSGKIVLVSDKDFVIRRMIESFDKLEKLCQQCWIVQLYFLVLRKDALAEGGLSMSTSGTISYNISENSIDVKDFKIEGLFSGLLQSSYADLFASPMFVLRDGITGVWSDGQRVPIPKRTVSDYGTVTTTGFDYVETGLEVKAQCKESLVGASLKLDISLSDIQSYVEGNPLTSQTKVNIDTDLRPNKIYLLSELQRYTLLDREEKTTLFSRNKGKSIIQVWGRVYKISDPNKEIHPFMVKDREFSKKENVSVSDED